MGTMLLQLIVSAFALHLTSALLPDHLRLKHVSTNQELDSTSQDESSIESVKANGIIREKCLSNGTEQSKFVMNQAYAAKEDLKDCFYSPFNYTVFLEEVKQSKQGDLHLVFTKYCKHEDTFQPCVDDFLTILEPCLNEGVLESVHNMREIFNVGKDLLCRKEVDVIGLFLQEDDLECIRVTRDDILRCYQDGLSCYVSQFPFGKEPCKGLKAFKTCTLKKLTPCGDRAWLYVDAIMTSVLEASLCSSRRDNQKLMDALAEEPKTLKEAWAFRPTSEEEGEEEEVEEEEYKCDIGGSATPPRGHNNGTIVELKQISGTNFSDFGDNFFLPTDYSVLQPMIILLILVLLAYGVYKVSTAV